MAAETANYNLKKPDITDKVDITVLNENADIIDEQLHNLAEGKQDELTFDEEPKDDSPNPVTSGGLKRAFDNVQKSLNFDSTPTAGSRNPVTSDGIKSYIDNAVAGVDVSEQLASKQDVLTWDESPKSGSRNPVTSGGLYTVEQTLTDGISDLQAQVSGLAAGLRWREAVDNFEAISTTYGAPEENWAVTVRDTGNTYVYNGEAWVLALVNATRFLTAAEAREILEG